jgi:hypothetical protein
MTDQPTSSATGQDPLPLLPRGQLLFEEIPLKAVVLEALAPALGNGTLVIRDRDRGAAVLVREGALVEVHAFTGGGASSGEPGLADVQGWSDAVVSAHRLDALLVDVCEALVRGEVIYTDLQVEWVEWPALLADFGRRGGAFAIELFTPSGRGVTCVALGRQTLSYTDIHPELGDPALLEAMAVNKEGSIRVRRLNPAAFAGASTTPGHQQAATAPGVPPAATEQAAPAQQPHPEGGANGSNGASSSEAQGGGGATAEQPGPADDRQRPATGDEVLPDLTWVAPWQTPWRDEPAAGSERGAGAGGEATPSVGAVLDDLRAIAQRRLQLSASRVESVLDEAAREERPLASVFDEIRAMSIRGVMPATVDAMVDEMSVVAAQHRSV